ncbi:MAG: protein kinase [Deltaproteobacteria bacterium]|nr:protein kinase [Deltaproteobacteria bacterium]
MGDSKKSLGRSAFKLPLPPPSEDERMSRLRVSQDLPPSPDPLAEPLGVDKAAPEDSATRLDQPPVRRTNPGTRKRREESEKSVRLDKSPSMPLKPKQSSSPRLSTGADPTFAIAGQLIGGRYRVVTPLGEGGMGKVFQVTHAQLGKTFALKIIHHRVADDDETRDLFYREARLASQLAHPHIASIVDFGEDEQVGVYMVMEYLEGEQLSGLLHREKQLGIKQACDIVLQIAEALHYIHSQDVIHCDIKTENIFVCKDTGRGRRKQRIKLLDFGLARRTAERSGNRLSGTAQYVSPERINGAKASPSGDIYGLGVLFFELLSGRPPFDGSLEAILDGHLEKEPPHPSDVRGSEVDPALEQLIARALAKDPAERHRDMNAFVYELRTVMHMLGFAGRKRAASTRVVEKVIRDRGVRRDELARKAFDHSRLPMAMLAQDGTIVLANPAFAKFVMGVATQVEGLTVQATPLAQVWRTLDTDLSRAMRGRAVRRTIEVAEDDGTRALVMRIEPGGDYTALFTVYPLQE